MDGKRRPQNGGLSEKKFAGNSTAAFYLHRTPVSLETLALRVGPKASPNPKTRQIGFPVQIRETTRTPPVVGNR